MKQRGDLQRAAVDEDAGLDRRARRQVLDELAHLVPVHGDRGEEGGGEADRHQAHLTGHGETAPGDDGAAWCRSPGPRWPWSTRFPRRPRSAAPPS